MEKVFDVHGLSLMRFVLADGHRTKLCGWYCKECGLFLHIQTGTEVEIELDKETVLKAVATAVLFIDDEMLIEHLIEQLEL